MSKPTARMIQLVMTELSRRGASKGGTTRAKNLTGRRRKEIARKTAAARWKKGGKSS